MLALKIAETYLDLSNAPKGAIGVVCSDIGPMVANQQGNEITGLPLNIDSSATVRKAPAEFTRGPHYQVTVFVTL